MLDEKFWLATSFAIFSALIWKLVWPKINAVLSKKSDEIAKEILRAKQLKISAQELLKQSQEALKNATREAEEIIEKAHKEAKMIAKTTQEELQKELTKLNDVAFARIKSEEEIAIRKLKSQIINQAFDDFSADLKPSPNQQKNLASQALDSLKESSF